MYSPQKNDAKWFTQDSILSAFRLFLGEVKARQFYLEIYWHLIKDLKRSTYFIGDGKKIEVKWVISAFVFDVMKDYKVCQAHKTRAGILKKNRDMSQIGINP